MVPDDDGEGVRVLALLLLLGLDVLEDLAVPAGLGDGQGDAARGARRGRADRHAAVVVDEAHVVVEPDALFQRARVQAQLKHSKQEKSKISHE